MRGPVAFTFTFCLLASPAAAGPAMVAPPAEWTPAHDGAGALGVETVARKPVLRGVTSERVEQADVVLEPGTTYVASVRVRGVGTTAASKALLYVTHSSGGKKKKSAAARFDAGGDEWQVLRVEFEAQAEAPLATVELSWDVASVDDRGTFLFADASLAADGGNNLLRNPTFKKTAKKQRSAVWSKLVLPKERKAPKGGEYVANGGFEATIPERTLVLGAKQWDYTAVYHKVGKIALVDADCHGGGSCLRMAAFRCTDAKRCGRTEPALVSQGVGLRPGKVYRLTAWVKMPDNLPATLAPENASHPGTIRLRLTSSGKTAEVRVPREATAWLEVSAEVAATTRDHAGVLEVDGFLTIDDLSLREIPALTAPEPAAAPEPAPAP